MPFTRNQRMRMRDDFRKVLREVASGTRYQNFSYKDAFEAVRRNSYYPPPFVVVCENPLEQQVITNAMLTLWEKKDKDFLDLFQAAKGLTQEQSVDISALETISREIFNLALAEVKRIVDMPESAERTKLLQDNLCKSHSAYYARLCYYSDFYYIWLEYLEKRPRNPKSKNRSRDIIPMSPEERRELQPVQKRSGIFSIILYEDVAIISKYPKRVHIDFDTLSLHSADGPAIEFAHSDPLFELKYYYVRNRQIRDSWIFENFTLERFINTSNEETRAAMYEILLRRGTDEMLNFLQAEEVDRARITHLVKIPMADVFGNFVGVKEETQEEEIILYRTKESIPMVVDPVTGRHTAKLAWIRFVCPSTGANFLISTMPSFNSALEAAKHSRPFNTQAEYVWTQRT